MKVQKALYLASVAPSVERSSEMIIATETLSQPEGQRPRQVKLLGATVEGLGTVVAVTTHLHCGFAIVRDALGTEHRLYFRDIKTLDGIRLAPSVPEYVTHTDRVAYGTWLELHEVVGQTTLSSVPALVEARVAA